MKTDAKSLPDNSESGGLCKKGFWFTAINQKPQPKHDAKVIR